MEAVIRYYDGCSNDDRRIVNFLLTKFHLEVIKTVSEPYTSNLLTTIKIKDNKELNNLLVELNSKTQFGVVLVETKAPQIKTTKKKFFKKKASSCKTFVGCVGQYSDDWLFETDSNSYSQQVCAAIDELMGEFSKDGDKFKIIIEKLGE